MWTRSLLGILLTLGIAGCASPRHTTAPQNAALSPLGSCETRVVSFHGAEAVVNANADSSLASIRVIDSPNVAARREVLAAIRRAFGEVRFDNDVVAVQSKWGLSTLTDRCGRPISSP